jgi:DNA-binding NtrC family response regulator
MVNEGWDVLVVDDEAVVCAAIRRVLEAEGLRVATAEDGASALAHPAASSCRMVLCDLMLPDRSGIEVIRALRESRPQLPVVVTTGYATPEQSGRAFEAGACMFLAKPFEESELIDIVRRALGEGTTAPEERES